MKCDPVRPDKILNYVDCMEELSQEFEDLKNRLKNLTENFYDSTNLTEVQLKDCVKLSLKRKFKPSVE